MVKNDDYRASLGLILRVETKHCSIKVAGLRFYPVKSTTDHNIDYLFFG